MGQYFDRIPDELKGHVKEITRTSGLGLPPPAPSSAAAAWITC